MSGCYIPSIMKYSSLEEKWNIGTHAFGAIASIPATWLMIDKSKGPAELWSSIIFGFSLIALYSASTLYHSAVEEEKRKQLRVLDHAAIFVLIAGTYTPICMISIWDSSGPILLIAIWTIALFGIILKLFFTGRYDRASTIMYIAMGWMAVFVINPLLNVFPSEALLWLLAGGISYTLGAVIYSLKKLSFNHAIFHFFVLGGSACHFVMIYRFVI